MDYRTFIAHAHQQLHPDLYLEIGIRGGHSLALSRSRSYGIDPAFKITEEINAPVRLFRQTSDEFFARSDLSSLFERPIDLAFIDGMHRFEFVYRDFMNVERQCSRNSIVIFDDIFPRTKDEATREQNTAAWTGDVWKMIYALVETRPDLVLIPIDTQPTGLLLACNLDPGSPVLQDGYEAAVSKFLSSEWNEPRAEILERRMAVGAATVLHSGVLGAIAQAGEQGDIREIVRARLPGVVLPGLQVVEPE